MANLVIKNNNTTGTESSINLKATNVDWKISGDKDNLKILKNGTQIAEIAATGFDATLTQADQAAQAEAVGAKISTINQKLDTIDTGANKYILPAATSSALGGVKIGYSENNKNYPVELDSDKKMYVNVPWTDTTYSNASQSNAGLMSPNDKLKLDYTNISYATCSTEASVAEKAVTIVGNTAWQLQTGAIIMVKFTNSNNVESPKLNVNQTGAKPIYYNNAVVTSTSSTYGGYANRVTTYAYDGTNWVWLSNSYDANSDTKVTQTAAITTAGEYPVILGYNTGTSSVTNTLKKTSTLKYNPSTQILTSPKFSGDGASLTNLNADNITSGTISISRLPYSEATNDTYGLVKIGYSASGKNYAVQLDSNGKMYVNVPWTDTTYTIPTALKNPHALTVKGNGTQSFTYDGSSAKTLNIKAGTNVSISSDTSGNITISSTDTNTTYTSGTGISINGTVINHNNAITAGTVSGGSGSKSFGGTFTIPKVTYDAQGHITATTTTTVTLPSTLSNGSSTAGLIKTSSTVSSASGYTACPVINGVPYYKDTTYTLSGLGGVPTTRTINGKALSANISLTYSDVGAAASSHTHKAGDITSGVLPIARGGTYNSKLGEATDGAIIVKKTDSSSNPYLGYISILPIVNGGTGGATELDAANNLKVYSLTEGTQIANGTDLNTLTTVGNYRCTNIDSVGSLTNCPTSNYFSMKVGHLPNNPTYLYQEIIVYFNGRHYYRKKSGTDEVWSDWISNFTSSTVVPVANGGTNNSGLATADDGVIIVKKTSSTSGNPFLGYISVLPITSGGTGGTTALEAANNLKVYSLNGGTQIANGTDLDTVTTIGNYRCTNATDVASLTNCPVDNALFSMKVGHLPNNSTYLYQELKTFYDGRTYYRKKSGSSEEWSNWYVDYNSYSAIPISGGGTGAKTALAARKNLGFTYGPAEPTGTPAGGVGSIYFRTGGDAVVEVGTDGIWTYRKWASGIAECWGKYTCFGVTATSSWGSMYESSRFALADYPFTFTEIPAQNISVISTGGSAFFVYVYGSYGPTTTSAGNVNFYRPTSSSTSQNVTLSIHTIGRWK